jgi:hypothetical protein
MISEFVKKKQTMVGFPPPGRCLLPEQVSEVGE